MQICSSIGCILGEVVTMSTDKQGKGSGEGSVERITSRPNENDVHPITKTINKTSDSVSKIIKK